MRNSFLAVVAAISTLTFWGCDQTPRSQAHKKVSELLKNGHYQEAVDTVNRELKQNPNDRELLQDRLLMLMGQQDNHVRAMIPPAFEDYRRAGGTLTWVLGNSRNSLPLVRQRVAFLLGVLQAEAGLKTLATLAEDRSIEVRTEAVHALGKARAPAYEELFLILLKDDAWSVRAEAAEALGNLGTPSASDHLLTAAADKDTYAKSKIRAAILQVADSSQCDLYLKYLKGLDYDKQVAAALALGKIKQQEAVPLLLRLVQDKTFENRREAAAALAVLQPAAAADIFEKLLPQEKDPMVKIGLLDYFRARNDAQSLRVLEEYRQRLQSGEQNLFN